VGRGVRGGREEALSAAGALRIVICENGFGRLPYTVMIIVGHDSMPRMKVMSATIYICNHEVSVGNI